jgi:hypothetical protein
MCTLAGWVGNGGAQQEQLLCSPVVAERKVACKVKEIIGKECSTVTGKKACVGGIGVIKLGVTALCSVKEFVSDLTAGRLIKSLQSPAKEKGLTFTTESISGEGENEILFFLMLIFSSFWACVNQCIFTLCVCVLSCTQY